MKFLMISLYLDLANPEFCQVFWTLSWPRIYTGM